MLNLKTLLAVSISFVLLTSCKKDREEKYYLSATINGVETSYHLPVIIADTSGPTYRYRIIAGEKSTTSVLFIFLINYNKTHLVPGTYSGTNNFDLQVVYKITASNKDYTNVAFSNFTVTISTINNSYVEGSFNGILKDVSQQTDMVTITNGKFKAPFQ